MSRTCRKKEGDPLIIKLTDLGTAFSLLTRVPLRHHWVDPDRLAASAWAFPCVGFVVGGLCGLILLLAQMAGLTPEIAAILALGAMILITGGLHEDGLADSADGLGGGSSKERALDIMKDSRIGTYGTLILVLFVIARWSCLTDLAQLNPVLGMAWIGAVSRLPMVALMAGMTHARDDGLSRHVGRPDSGHVMIAIAITALITLMILGLWGVLAMVAVVASTLPLAYLALRKIGGQTGDILGGAQQCAELTALIILVMIWI